LTIYWRKITRAGAWVGLMSGFWFAILWYCLVYYKTAPSISGVRLSGLTPYLDPLFLAIPISFVLTIIVSLISKQLPKEHIDVAFENI
ncbi:sodium:solute symporter, partial [Candidatus Bathyarchaeota archaeon]|nr:sodium:solute symporter [Candidatus Bathyarchaeota archaeon]